MRVPILLFCSALAFHSAHAETLSDADRETLLGNLEKIQEESSSKSDARFRIALAAFRNAMSNDDAAMELYINCMEKVNFEELHKKAADFREWKTKEREELADPGLRLALRHQLRWLMLTLEAASEKPNHAKLASDAQEAVDAIFRDADKLKYQQEILTQPVTATVFARAYDINNVKVEGWALSPIDVDGIYDNILLPPYRRPSTLAALRSGWVKRIQQETVKMEHWSKRREPRGENRGDREERRVGMAADMQSPEYLKFLEDDLPKLQWEMEVDLYENGDEANASVRMLALLQKYTGHASAREWADEFKKLLKPAVVAPAPKPLEEPAP
ncbi:MAG: hypothetical protein V4819_07890 [Verrucomicrobiota bacterium]